MPLLDVDWDNFPVQLLHGQVEKLTLTLKNSGTSALRNIKLKLSHPSFFSFESGVLGQTVVPSRLGYYLKNALTLNRD